MSAAGPSQAAMDAMPMAMLRTMLLIRRVEERLSAEARAGTLPGGVHLTIGQEAVAAGVCAHLRASDAITSNHRGHGHFLAKGGSPAAMVAEVYGKDNGICRGMGGSMHVADVSRGMLGANGIVGAGLAIAAGVGPRGGFATTSGPVLGPHPQGRGTQGRWGVLRRLPRHQPWLRDAPTPAPLATPARAHWIASHALSPAHGKETLHPGHQRRVVRGNGA